MQQFEVIEHTADTGIRAFGATAAQAFENAAAGMFSLLADPETVDDRLEFPVTVEAEDRETLLVEWLNELLYVYESNGVLLSRFLVERLSETALSGKAYGESITTEKHDLKTDIKAATYYQLRVDRLDGGWVAEVIFDV